MLSCKLSSTLTLTLTPNLKHALNKPRKLHPRSNTKLTPPLTQSSSNVPAIRISSDTPPGIKQTLRPNLYRPEHNRPSAMSSDNNNNSGKTEVS